MSRSARQARSRSEVAIVGGGIGGLTLAAALARAGTPCVIYEGSGRLGATGAGLQLSPNATRLLHRLGLATRLDAVAVRPAAIEMRRWQSGDVIARTELGAECETRYGAPYYCVHRADLHRALLGLVGGTGLVTIHTGHRCVSVAEADDHVDLHFADGSRSAAEVVIGADGIHSVVRQSLAHDDGPTFSGLVVYRGLVAAERRPHLVAEPRVLIWLGPGQHCVWYPVSSGSRVSFVAAVPADGWRQESWTAPGDVRDLLAAYAGWHDDVLTMLGGADTVTRWALHQRATPRRWRTNRITVIGDAAHPMLPLGAQGASQAIESAVALAACLRDDDVPTALGRYEQVRVPRLAQVRAAVAANVGDHHLADGERQRQRDLALVDRRSLASQEWLYGYDAERTPAIGRISQW